MKFAIVLHPIYDPNKKNAHSLAAKSWVTKVIGLLSGRKNLKLSVFLPGQMLSAINSECKKEAKQLKSFVENKQLEFLGGSYNDAMLPLFPKKLQELQLQKHKEMLSHFMEPEGYFCPSHAWEIGLIEILEKSGFTYTLMPDTSIQGALGRKSAVSGWFTAEYGSSFMRILTYSKNLSSVCQNSKRADIINSLKKIKGLNGVTCILLGVNLDEALPGNEWLQALDTAGAEDLDIEHNLLYQTVMEQKTSGRVNLISYSEFAPSCRDILLRMPEINFLHKKILNVYFRARSLDDPKTEEQVFEKLLDAMQQSYFKNTADGMLCNNLRFYANRSVMKAEKILWNSGAENGIRFAMSGFFLDGNQQLMFSNPNLECLIEPTLGGWVRSLIYKPSLSELACSMRDDGEVSPLFLNHICPFEFENLYQRNSWISDRLGAFLDPYESSVKIQEDKVQVLMQSEQNISYSGKDYSFKTEKIFSLKNNGTELLASISITNASFSAFNGEFATELCLSFTKYGDNFFSNVKEVNFKDRSLGVGVDIEINKSADIMYSPILGISDLAVPNTVQGLRLVIFRKVKLKGQESEAFHLRISLNRGGLFS